MSKKEQVHYLRRSPPLDRSGYPDGVYNGAIQVTSNGGDATVNVTMTVAGPQLSVSTTSLDFGTTTTSMVFNITNTGGPTLIWNVIESIPWIDAVPTSGSGDQSILVTVDRSGLAPGMHSGLIDVTSNGGNATVTVTTTH